MKTPPDNRVLTHVVVDDTTISRDDPQAIIDPVWWSADFYESVDVLEDSLAPFSWAQRLVWAVLWTDAEVCNGGLDQFFSNSTGMIWPEAVEGFAAIGREDLSNILREAVACFPSPPARDRKLRQKALEGLNEGALDDLTNRYYDAEGNFYDDLLTYIRSQPEAFYFDGHVYAPPPLPPINPGN